ncbi:MAG TPA: PEP-CTERM/exosortase system-associated acyltransferase [Stellaceae bacterium]|jgi:N-acyl amino acid synthase of PEP-CTERM/exosortase system|nr:PEP-CTERM/exosortase system-associated acyltransferase [Stellaceae bacterium]
MPDFVGSYDQYFTVLRADTRERRDDAYRLRYQVYCIENQFEDRGRCRDGREFDDDDDRSVHTLLVHRRSSAAVGTARLILPRPDALRPLPIQEILWPRERMIFERLPLHRTAEVSRFAVSKEFRRRCGEERFPDVGFSDRRPDPAASERRLLPHITLGLLRGILGICLEYEISILAAVMEPALLRVLCRLGLDFVPLGPLVEHHGRRQPCVAPIAELIRGSRDRAGPLWRYVEADLSAMAAVPAIAARAGMPAEPGHPPLSSARGFP